LDEVEQLRENLKDKIYEKASSLQKTFRTFDYDHTGISTDRSLSLSLSLSLPLSLTTAPRLSGSRRVPSVCPRLSLPGVERDHRSAFRSHKFCTNGIPCKSTNETQGRIGSRELSGVCRLLDASELRTARIQTGRRGCRMFSRSRVCRL